MALTKPVRVAVLIKEIYAGRGQTTNVLEIASFLHRTHPEVEVSIYVPGRSVGTPVPSYVRLVPIRRYYTCLLGNRWLSSQISANDIGYIQGNFPYIIPATRSKKPTILVVQHIDSPRFVNGSVAKLRVLLTNVIRPYFLRRADVLTTVTTELAEYYYRTFSIKARIVEDLIGSDFFTATSKQPPRIVTPALKLLTVGDWDGRRGRKRHTDLIDHFAVALSTYPKAHLTLAGLSGRSAERLNMYVKSKGVAGSVTLVGFLETNELIRHYCGAHIYVTATTFEGFYRQAVEAFATGLPIVAYDARRDVADGSQAACANHVVKSGAGELFTDARGFVNGLGRVLSRYDEYSRNARQYALRFSPDSVGEKVYRLIQDTVEGGRA